MKTVLEELRFMCNNFIGQKLTVKDVNNLIDNLLEREKKQIVGACETGISHGWLATIDPRERGKGEKYFEQNYVNAIKLSNDNT